MDIAITASKVIDRAILLEEGGAIVIPCSSYEEMEKLRTRLYKIRRQLKSQHRELSSSIDITRKVRENKWTLYITKDTGLSGVFIVEDGEAKPFTLEEQAPEQVSEEEPLEQAPEDFDEVAARMEEAQDLQEETADIKFIGEAPGRNEETSKNNIS